MNRIQRLIEKGELKQAVQQMQLRQEDRLALIGRINNLDRDIRLGVIDYNDANKRRSTISVAVINLAKEKGYLDSDDDLPAKSHYRSASSSGDRIEQMLLKIAKEQKRRSTTLHVEALSLLDQYKDYNTKKATQPTFDLTERRLRALQDKIRKFKAKVREKKEDGLEATIEQINELLSKPVPSYESLQEAYGLVAGRTSTSSAWIEKALLARIHDDEIRISIAEQIEAQATELSNQ
ncbi:MAG: hypothetical protein AAF738_03965 [Bacteroidota bacterium]